MKRGVAVVLIGASRVGSARLVTALVIALAAVLAASVLALVAARTAEAAFPGGNGKIAFQSDRHGPVEIYAMTSRETARRITTSNNSSDPSYSPDGRRIAFISGSKTNSSYEVWVMNADGSGRRQVTKTSVAEQEPGWSPDGTKLVYASNSFDKDRQTDLEIWTINVDGTERRQLTNNSSSETQPAWSPDGSRIAFVRGQDVWVMNSDGSGTDANLTPNSPPGCSPDCYGGIDDHPSWSPDGTQIVYSNNGDGDADLHKMDANPVTPPDPDDNLTDANVGKDLEPAWSPGGDKIAYVATTPTSTDHNIYVIDANAPGSGTAIDTIVANDVSPDWQPITLAVNDVRIREKSTNAAFTVNLPTASSETITVNYATADGTARTPTDYTAQSGTLTFEPGQTTQQISAPIRGDRRNESNEFFFVNLSGATNAVISDAQGRATIVDND
jgi:Tol biopolymer transport system component